MTPLHRKWAALVICLSLIGAGVFFLFWMTSQSEKPASPKRPAAVQATVKDNPEHELKELAVQLKKKPGHVPVLMRMAQIEHDQSRLAEAAAHLREAITSEPANADAHLELGRVLYEKGDHDEALKETEQALAINPKQVDAMYNLGAIHANAGNTERALSYWQDAVKSAPESDSGKKAREALARLRGSENRR